MTNQYPAAPPAKRTHWIRNGVLGFLGISVALAVIGSIVGGGPADTAVTAAPAIRSIEAVADVPASSAPAATASEPQLKLPDLRGKGLQAAQDQAQAAGFYGLKDHDALGRGRTPLDDRSWKVCSQIPKAGGYTDTTEIDLGAVKLDEKCPAKDAGLAGVQQAGVKMPNLIGKSGSVAEQTLGTGASITWTDGTGDDRAVFVPSNWKVCKQSPRGGQRFDGVPVELTVVKFEERC